MRVCAASLLPLVACGAVLADGLTVLDFDAYEFGGGGSTDIGASITEDGYTIAKDPGDTFNLFVFNQGEARYPGSAAPFNNTGGGLLRLTSNDGLPFDMVSIDLCSLNGATPVTINFTGTKLDGGTVNASYTTGGVIQDMERFAFPADFCNLVQVDWFQDSPFHQFDNIMIGKGSVVTRPDDAGANWFPLNPGSGSYVYATDFVASENGTVDQLGTWLLDQAGDGGPNVRFEVWGSIGGNVANGPDAGNVIASTGSLNLPGNGTTRFFSAQTEFSDVIREGRSYWFVATVVGEAGASAWEVGRNTGGQLWFSNDPAGVNFDGQGFTPGMAFSVGIGSGGIEAYYIDSGNYPWNDEFEYNTVMDCTFPCGWVRETYDTVNTNALFNKKTRFIYLEGSDSSASELASFLAANSGALEAWVANGGALFLNAAPNEGGNINFGFGGVTCNYPIFNGSVSAVNPIHQVFEGPFGRDTANFTGTSYAHATITGPAQPVLIGNDTGGTVIAEKCVGKGGVLFGGITSWGFHNPDPDAELVFKNYINYALSLAQGNVIEFDEQEFDNASTNDLGDLVCEDGFQFTKGDARPFAFKAFGKQESRYPSSAALFNDTVDGLIRLSHKKEKPFELCSIDISPLNGPDPVTVNFTGFKAGGGTVNASFTTSGNAIALETFTLPNNFNNLVAVEWTQAAPFHQFDNVRIVMPQTMTFDRFRFKRTATTIIGDAVSEDGYTINQGPNEPFRYRVRGTEEAAYAGSPGVFNNTVGGLMSLRDVKGECFDICSIDIAPLSFANPVTVSFTGIKCGGGTVSASFTHSGNAVEYETFMFPPSFTNLAAVEWTQDSPFHQFDNIVFGQAEEDCFADCDGNGVLNILDFVCYQALFQAGDPGADCDGNGVLNILDFVCFQASFQAGCP